MDVEVWLESGGQIYLDLKYPKFTLRIVSEDGTVLVHMSYNKLESFLKVLQDKLKEFRMENVAKIREG